jgi:hypothetical protein
MPPNDARRIAFLGEFGGLGLPVPGHLWAEEGSWGYRTLPDAAALEARYAGLMLELASLRERGLAGAIYTQLTDVETEVNGLQTYDREVVKVDPAALRALHERVRAGFPAPRPLRATSEDEPRPWRHVTTAPPDGWTAADFDDAAWTAAPGGFGTAGTPGAVVGTEWDGSDIWLRAELELDAPADDLWLRLHHDEDAEVWLDGELLGRFAGYTTRYIWHPLRRRALAPGRHVLAVHCRQTTGGQFLDAGLYTLAR